MEKLPQNESPNIIKLFPNVGENMEKHDLQSNTKNICVKNYLRKKLNHFQNWSIIQNEEKICTPKSTQKGKHHVKLFFL